MTSLEADAPADVYEILALHARQISEQLDTMTTLKWSPRQRTVIVLIYSEKGGVGKTALTTGLAATAAAHGLQVLVIDLDPRATATEELGITMPEYSVNDILYVAADDEDPVDIRGAASDYMLQAGTGWPDNIRILAAERALGNREMDNTDGMTGRLAASLQGDALADIDVVLVDVPPRAGGKLAAAAVQIPGAVALIPATLDQDGWKGAVDALTTLHRTRRAVAMDPVPIVGVLRHIVDRRRTQLGAMFDTKMRTEAPIADLLLRDVAVPRRGIRAESRALMVPITAASGPDARAVLLPYTIVLNHIAEKA
jgi:chromosome partitioning protein